MSRAIAAARPSIKSAVAAGRQPTPQSTKQTRPMADCRSASIKALPRRRPAAIIPPLRRLVSPRLTRRSHPDCRAIAYALRSVSILQTWTYKPQKRQDVSDFALTYSLRLRSCKSLDAFIISSLPSRLKETLQTAGPLRSTDITPLPRYYWPARHPLVFGRLPGFAGYTAYLAPAISRWDEEGLSSCSACPCHRAVASTPPRLTSVSVSLRLLMRPSPSG